MKTQYVSCDSTASMAFAEFLNGLLFDLPGEAGYDMMKFLYGSGQ